VIARAGGDDEVAVNSLGLQSFKGVSEKVRDAGACGHCWQWQPSLRAAERTRLGTRHSAFGAALRDWAVRGERCGWEHAGHGVSSLPRSALCAD
jgi:hypothetical protein